MKSVILKQTVMFKSIEDHKLINDKGQDTIISVTLNTGRAQTGKINIDCRWGQFYCI